MAKSQNDNTNADALDKAIARVLEVMESHDPTAEAYSQAVDQLDKLYKIQVSTKPDRRINLDALVAVAGNLAGIAMILNFEKAGIVTSKALGFVLKSKAI